MSYQVLYRTYRPARFGEVVGQDYIIKTLVNAIKNRRIAHAYLFAGPRGTGKTSVAKLFAKAINCDHFNGEACDDCQSCRSYLGANHPDIIELDAASNNGIDDIRDIIEQVPYAPMLGRYKVYIIDEVHMLSTQAFNALLKTLEEPPAHVVFILATTDPQKVLPTVLSRCQRYNFSKISSYEIKERTMEILNKEGIPFEEKAVEEIARLADGGMRDALSLLEQCLSYDPDELKLEDVEHIFGLTSTAREVELFKDVHEGRISEAVSKVRDMYFQGMNLNRLAADLLDIVKDALIYSDQADASLLGKVSELEVQQILSLLTVNGLLKDAKAIEDLLMQEKQNQNFLTYLELCLIEMAKNGNAPEAVTTKSAPEEKKEMPKQEEKTVPAKEEIKEEKKAEETAREITEEKIESFVIEPETDFLLAILLDANRDLKVADQIIYNRLDLYMYDTEKRKFYQLLMNTELFASNKDAIIVVGNRTQADNINTKINNEDLYRFLNEEFGIDKMIYAIDENKKKELIGLYKKTPAEQRNRPVYVEKYKLEDRPKTTEEKLKDMFDDVKIEG